MLPRTTKLAQSTSQCSFVVQALHKVLPNATLYYKACTKHFPTLLHTTKSTQSISQLEIRLKLLWHDFETTLKQAWKLLCITKLLHKYFPILLRTSSIAQSTSQHYFVLRSLHKTPSPTTCTRKPAQRTHQSGLKLILWIRMTLQGLHKCKITHGYKCFKHVETCIGRKQGVEALQGVCARDNYTS